MLRNPEFKATLIRVFLVQIIIAAVFLIWVHHELNTLNNNITDQNIALAGRIMTLHPELEGELIDMITEKSTRQEIENGMNALKKYGYGKSIIASDQPLLEDLFSGILLKGVLFVLLCFAFLFLFVGYEYKKIFTKIRIVSSAVEKVVDGDFSMLLADSSEGEFGILGHRLNQMTERLKWSLEKLREDKVFLKNIISDISHQIKTPLASLLMFNELMIEDVKMTAQTKDTFLRKSRSQMERLEWLVLSLLKMARLEAGAISFNKSQTSFAVIVRNALSSLSMHTMKKSLNIQLEESEAACFYGDAEWMCEALVNIIKNSIEHTEAGGYIIITMSETPLFSRISIKDNGEGIDALEKPHIFKRFYRGTHSVKTESVGIGLALSKLIIEGQGGSITVQSQKGVGTEFVITFLKGVI